MPELDQDYIPGTDHLFEDKDTSVDDGLLRDGNIVLVPQPTISPNDPLTWSKWRKYLQVFLLLSIRGVAAANSATGFAPAPILVSKFHFSYEVFDNYAAVLYAAMSFWVFVTAPSVFLYGLRFNYILGMLFGVIGMAWFANVAKAGDIYGSQFLVGFSTSCSEAAVVLSFSQMFYQHQVDTLVALYVFTSLIGFFVGPLVAGYLATDDGWDWVGYSGLIAAGVMFLLVVFTLEETYFDRDHFATRSSIDVNDPVSVNIKEGDVEDKQSKKDDTDSTRESTPAPSSSVVPLKSSAIHQDIEQLAPQETYNSIIRPDIVDEAKQTVPDEPHSIFKRLALVTVASNVKGYGIKQYGERLWLLLRVFTFPPVLFAGIQWGLQMSWITFYMTLESSDWTGPPWNYTTASVGIMFVPTLIGALAGFLYSVFFVKWFLKIAARRNGGILEAETRLWCLIPGLLSSSVGLIVLGIGTDYKWSWPVPYVMLGFIGFGFGTLGDLSMAYCVDCYPEMVLESIVGVAFLYDAICCVLSAICPFWLEAGEIWSFASIGIINFALGCLMFPMIFYGKRCRRWTRSMYYDFVQKRDSLNS